MDELYHYLRRVDHQASQRRQEVFQENAQASQVQVSWMK